MVTKRTEFELNGCEKKGKKKSLSFQPKYSSLSRRLKGCATKRGVNYGKTSNFRINKYFLNFSIILGRKLWEPSTVRRWLEEEVMRKTEEQRSDDMRRIKAKMSYKLKEEGFKEEQCGSEMSHNTTLARIMKHSSQVLA